MNVVALDVETANRQPSSICAIGIAQFEQRQSRTWYVAPTPPDFEPRLVAIHGIDSATVKDAPPFAEAWRDVVPYITGTIVVAHNAAFDTRALLGACQVSGVTGPTCRIGCSLRLARAVWPGRSSYSLDTITRDFGIPLVHHDAGSDASAVLAIIDRAMLDTGASSVERLFEAHSARLYPLNEGKPVLPSGAQTECDLELELLDVRGKRFAFTGSLMSMRRSAAQQLVESYGVNVTNSVSEKLDVLVVGDGGDAGAKLEKADNIIQAGGNLHVLSEESFLRLFGTEETASALASQLYMRGTSIDIQGFLEHRAATDPEFARELEEWTGRADAELKAMIPEQLAALEASQLAAQEEEDAWRKRERKLREDHRKITQDRTEGVVGTQTEIGRPFGLSAVAVGRILDTHSLRDVVDVDVDGITLRLCRGVRDGFAVYDALSGRQFWVAARIAPLLDDHVRGKD